MNTNRDRPDQPDQPDQSDTVDDWYKFASQCDSSPALLKSVRGDEALMILRERWARDCPALEAPEVVVDEITDRHKVIGLNVRKK